jgi:hypothetical protein
MHWRVCLSLIVLVSYLSVAAGAREPESFVPRSAHETQSVDWDYPMSSPYSSPFVYAQGWPAYGYPYSGGNYFQSYDHSSHFPYLYFYEQYAREAEESGRAADEYEAGLAREGKLTGPLEVGAFTTDYLPRSPLKQRITLDGEVLTPSPGSAPLVIESGEHRLQIGSHQGNPGS